MITTKDIILIIIGAAVSYAVVKYANSSTVAQPTDDTTSNWLDFLSP